MMLWLLLSVADPTRISVGPGDFGQLPETTPRNMVLLTGRARLLVDTPNLFGTIGLDAQLRASFMLNESLWLTVSLSAFEYRNVINASITETQMALGPLTAAVHYRIYAGERLHVTPYARVLLPTASSTAFGRQLGLEVGLSAAYVLHEWLTLLGGVMMPAASTILGSRAVAFVWPTVAAELAFHPARWFTLLGGVEVRLSGDPAGVLEYVAPKFALRFYPIGGLVLEAKGMLPMGGQERHDYVLGFSGGWTW